MIQFDPFDPAFIADPYPVYDRLRSEDPVHQSPLGFWILTRYDDVAMLLRDGRFGKREYQGLLRSRFGPGGGLGRSMLFRDPPDHTRLRTLVSKAFTARVVESLRANIQEIVHRLLDEVQDAGAMDVIEDLAYPLPVIVICEMMGVPAADRDRFKHWSYDVARSLDAISTPAGDIAERGSAAVAALTEYFGGLLQERRARPRADLLSALIAAEEQGDRLSEEELFAMGILLFVAGHETTVNLIGNGTLALLRNPGELAKLRSDPSLIQTAVEELLRYDGPVQRDGRFASEEIEIGGRKVAKGDLILAFLGAANRDPAQFPEPNRLQLARQDNRHMAFGGGVHFCLGAPLARAEAQIAIGTLVRRMPRLALRTETPEWRTTSTLRGLRALPVAF